MYKGSAVLKSLNISYQGDAELLIHVNRNCLHTIIRNLIHNAVKFTPENGSITVKTSSDENNLMIEVIDNGLGMTEDEITDMLAGNARVKQGTNAEIGTGFGIGLCLTYIRQIQGKLSIQSTPNQGSTFTFTIPYHTNQ